MHAHLLRHPDQREELVKHRHHHGAAADPEQAREHAHHGTGRDERGGERDKIGER